MHALAFLSLVASTALVAAAQDEFASFQPLSTFGALQARQQQQSCASVGAKTCGSKCIRFSYTCCGNGAGACEPGYACGLAANGIYGCCPFGKRCGGDAPDPSTSNIGVARPTTVPGAGDNDDDDETTTRAAESTPLSQAPPVPPANTPVPPSNTPVPPANTPVPPANTPVSPVNTPARTTAVGSDDETTTSSSSTIVATSRSTTTTRSAPVALGSPSIPVNGSGGESSNNGNSNNNGNGSGSSSTASSGGNTPQASSAGVISVELASLAGGFLAAIAFLL